MSDLENIAAHALHNAFIVVKDTGLDWPHPTSVDFIKRGTVINVTEVTLRPTQNPFDAFEIWVAVQWKAMPEHAHYTEFHYPLEFLTDRCDMLDVEGIVVSA